MPQVFLLSCSALLVTTAAWKCGIDDPIVGKLLLAEPSTQNQVYETPEMIQNARRLVEHGRALEDQWYHDNGTFVPLSVADSSDDTAAMRIAIVWDIVDGGDNDFYDDSVNPIQKTTIARQCSAVGDVISIKSASSPSGWLDYTDGCSAKMVVQGSTGAARYQVMKTRTEAAAKYWASTLKVKPVKDTIRVPDDPENVITVNFGILPGTAFPKADLVLLMTARPSPETPIAGFAICYQKDQRGRCTVGQFNWVPEILNIEAKDSPDTIESELHTALHEMMHVLGGMSPGTDSESTVFIDNVGRPKSGSLVFLVQDDPVYSSKVNTALAAGSITYKKQHTLIITPKVVEVARKWFNCPNATGFPLEDVPLGKGSHWEARVAGPEFMSYGAGSGQIYVSDLSLAFLEDTGQYIVNYGMAGQILPAQVDEITTSQIKLPSEDTGNEDYKPPAPLPAGALRWGMGEGCSFLTGRPAVTWPKSYLCTANQKYTCTPDGRMSAVCIVRGDWSTVSSKPSCGVYNQRTPTNNAGSYGALCEVENDSPAQRGIPTYMQHFATDAEAAAASARTTATASSTGGYNDAMDYVPVPVGYWNCMYAKPSDNKTSSKGAEYGSLGALTAYFGSATDMDQFGGQARCPECRCFPSSLVEITKAATMNPTFPEYGLCYRSNCYRPDYLQVGVKSVTSGKAQWYKCPAEGGKLYIPGFAGALTCPVASEFCKHMNVTGTKYPEVDLVYEAVFWGVLIGGGLFLALFLTCPCFRDRIIGCGKLSCGAYVLEDPDARKARLAARSVNVKDLSQPLPDPMPLPRCASITLFSVNILTMLIGLIILAITAYSMYLAKVYSFGVTMLGLGLCIVAVSIMGVCGSRARAQSGPSCWVLSTFFFDLIVSVLLIWGIAWNLAFADYAIYVDRYYDVILDAIPKALIEGKTRAEAVTAVAAYLKANFGAVAGMAIAALLVFVVNMVAAGKIITGTILNSIALTIVNNVMLLFGLLMTVVGWYLSAYKENAGGNPSIVALIVACGMLFLVISAQGHVAVFGKRIRLFISYIVCSVLMLCVVVACTYVCFAEADKVVAFVNAQDDDKLGGLASSLGSALTKQTLVAALQTNLRQLGLAFGVVVVLQLFVLVNCAFFLHGLKAWNAGQGKTLWGADLPAGTHVKAAGGKGPVASKPGRTVVAASHSGTHTGGTSPMNMTQNKLQPKGRSIARPAAPAGSKAPRVLK